MGHADMIVIHDKNGRINGAIYDPVPETMKSVLNEKRENFIVAENVPESFDLLTHYVSEGNLIPRPTCNTNVTLNDRVVKVDTDSSYEIEIEDERISHDEKTFEVDEPGKIVLYINHPWPILPEVINLEIS